MVGIVRHRQLKGSVTDRFHLNHRATPRLHKSRLDAKIRSARMDNFLIEVELPSAFSEQHRDGVQEAIHHCLIHNTLMHPPKIALNVTETMARFMISTSY
jgi:hypothetical protein